MRDMSHRKRGWLHARQNEAGSMLAKRGGILTRKMMQTPHVQIETNPGSTHAKQDELCHAKQGELSSLKTKRAFGMQNEESSANEKRGEIRRT
ncbi:hypothetical protein DVH24_019137 [Malus domestica]|uniref:Uncharacterized protein n=1 Tax=Malus domestica TaxID=3750 RepID=A0A498I017_MALDO|nr:hypothetical protein DVH24_019137 [Malus domestica]